jgi:curved DNA-binding protein CbpA
MHPQRNPAEHKSFFTTKFAAISEAYEVLSKPSTKAIYDQFGI